MSNLLTYSGIITKVKAMEARFITKEDFEHIATLESAYEFISFLKQKKGFSHIFQNVDEYSVHRGEIEGIFVHGLYQDYAKIYRFANIEQRNALDLLFFRYEVNILKACIQSLYGNNEKIDLSLFEDFFFNHSKLNINTLTASTTIDEFINNLKGTKYYSLFVRLTNTNHNTPFDYEMQLDIYYFKKAWKLKDKLLSGANQKAFTNILGVQIDLFNIMCLYRSKRYYSIHSSIYYGYIIPINYKLDRISLTRLLETQSIDEFMNILKVSYYKGMVNHLVNNTIEFYLDTIVSKVYKLNSEKYAASMAPVFYFLHHKEAEINLLTTALECIRYKLDPAETLKFLL